MVYLFIPLLHLNYIQKHLPSIYISQCLSQCPPGSRIIRVRRGATALASGGGASARRFLGAGGGGGGGGGCAGKARRFLTIGTLAGTDTGAGAPGGGGGGENKR